MCLAIPARVVELRPCERALVEVGGVRREVSVQLVDDVQPDDYLIVHVGFALSKLDPAEAAQTLALFEQIAAHLAAV
ncbi:MAG: HypC/HybG/HupF family hydrogenase formation chaperone [Sterolibacteriaceae bacterium]|nr:HypC/HybG/HupF family hydrogenase formation chaperone [Sterolibacteriaceae bacterium]MBK9086750.1 HypC/HybG/HupF family hydrogenase formation chaperone [Sterolibacteriaceae bacterium]